MPVIEYLIIEPKILRVDKAVYCLNALFRFDQLFCLWVAKRYAEDAKKLLCDQLYQPIQQRLNDNFSSVSYI